MAALPINAPEPMPIPDVYRGICQVALAISREGVAKGGKNAQQGYKFRGIDDICNALSPLIAGAELCILPRMISRSQAERATIKGGVLFYVVVQADFDFVSSRDGSKHTVTMFGEAMDSADKATNKAMSAALKYCLMQVFCIPTEGARDDADAVTHQLAPKVATKPQVIREPADKSGKFSRAGDFSPANVGRPQPAAELTDALPEFDYEEVELPEDERSQLERELADSITLMEKRKTMLDAFGVMKNRYAAIEMQKTFYAILKLHGVSAASEFKPTAEGQADAVACFAEMRVDIAMREGRQ